MSNPFASAIRSAEQRGAPKYADVIRKEAMVIRKLLTIALERGLSVSVNDGEEWTVRRSRDFATVFSALRTTDEDRLRFWDGDKQEGDVRLIYGNSGWDVIADYSVGGDVEDLMIEVSRYADGLGA